MGSHTLELKWANHKSNLTSELQELYLSDSLLDVTIACGEFTLKAHKTVLSASSTFFRKLFLDNPCKHPILIMTDVDFGDLKTIIEFMYQGEIHISREKLTKFLKTAERLKIKGLSSIEDMNLNTPEHCEIEVDPHYSSGAWEHTSIQSQAQDLVPIENVHSSPKKVSDSKQNDTNQEISTVKREHEISRRDSDNCMYWQSECFDQASSSSVLPDCNLPSPPVSHQLPTPVSHQLTTAPVSHQLSTASASHQLPTASVSHQLTTASVSHQLPTSSVSHQLSNPSTSHQLSNPSVSHQLGMSLSSECFTYPETQADNGTLTQVQEENTGRDIVPVNLYQSQDQLPIAIPANTKSSFEAIDSLSSQSSSQGGKTGSEAISEVKETLIILTTSLHDTADNSETCEDLSDNSRNTSSYECNFCQKSFITHDMLTKHLHLHSKLNKYVCTVCNYRFSWKSSLQNHLRTHTGEKPFECSVCHKRFSQRPILQHHERTHTGNKPFTCKVCHKQFLQLSTLQSHEKIHAGEKPFECNVCHKQFVQQASLKYHERIHTAQKHFAHKICHN